MSQCLALAKDSVDIGNGGCGSDEMVTMKTLYATKKRKPGREVSWEVFNIENACIETCVIRIKSLKS